MTTEQTMRKWPIGEDSDVVRLCVRQDRRLDVAMEKVVRRLERFHRQCAAELVQLLRVEVGDADVTDFACRDELCQSAGRFRERCRGIRPVHLEQIDVIGCERAQAIFDTPADPLSTRVALHASAAQRSQAALCRDNDVFASVAFYGLRKQLLRRPKPVTLSGVEEVDAAVIRVANRADRRFLIRRAPVAAKLPGAKSDARNVQSTAA